MKWIHFPVLLVMPLVLSGPDILAQETLFPPAPREQRQRLTKAARAIEEGDYSDAVRALGELLAGSEDDDIPEEMEAQDFFLNPPGVQSSGTLLSMKAEAQRMLGEMNSKGRELYELRFGPQARALLDKAIASGDSQQLMDITRRYFHTKAGYESTVLLGRQHLSEGRPLAAAMNFQRLARWREARDQFEPQLSLLLATSWLQAGITDKAQDVMVDLKTRRPDAAMRIGGENVNLFTKTTDAMSWLRQWSESEGARRLLDEDQWVMHRGNARRNASSRGDLPLLNHRWRVPTVNNPDDEALVSQAKRQKSNLGLTTVSSLQPLAVDDTVIMRTPDHLWAVNFKTGKRIWEWPWKVTNDPLSPPGGTAGGPRTAQLQQRLWSDSAYGQMSSDGESLYFLTELGFTGGAGSQQIRVAGGGFVRVNSRGTAAQPHNELMALSLRREGAKKWSVGGKHGGFEEQLAEAFFLGPPLPLQGRLYVIAEVKSEVRLVVLNANTGKLIWQQQLAHLDNATITRMPARRLTGASPSFSDGVLVCPTSAGGVVGLDVSTRSLLWGYRYDTNQQNMQKIVFSSNRTNTPARDKWLDASPTIADNYVLLTPPESDELHCVDLLTGKEAKWSPIRREEMLFVAAVHNGVAMMVGKNEIRAINLETGQPAWDPVKLSDGAGPSGFGFFSDGHYYLPTTKKNILKVAVTNGKVAEKVATSQELGNLICYSDNIISQSTEWVSSYYQRSFLREEVAARLRANPNDQWALARQCELLLQDGKRDEALVALRRAHKLTPGDSAIRVLLVDTLMSLLRSDFEKHSHLIDELGGLIERPSDKNEFAMLRAIGLEKSGRIREAFQAVIELLPREGVAPNLEEIDDALQVRRDRWVAARIASLSESAAKEDIPFLNNVVNTRLQAALKEDSPGALRNFLRGFAGHPLAREARLELARDFVKADELLAAELELDGIDNSDDDISGHVVALRATLLTKAGRHQAAADQYRRLALGWPDLMLKDGPAEKIAMAALQSPNSRLAKWPVGQVRQVGQASTVRRSSSYQRVYEVEMDEISGDAEEQLTAVVDQRTNNLVIRDGLGRTRQTLPLTQGARYYTSNYALTRGRMVGHLMLITLGYEMLAIDTLQKDGDGLLWRQSLYDQVPGGAAVNINQLRPVQRISPWGTMSMVAGDTNNRVLSISGPAGRFGVVYQKMREIVCVDALTGDTIWSRQGLPIASQIMGDDRMVIVAPPEGGQATVLSAIDGSVVGRRPIESLKSRWTSWGRNTISHKREGNNILLRLYDVWSGETLWEDRFPMGSQGAPVGGDEVVVLRKDGQLQVISMRDGALKLDTTISPEPQLTHLQALRSSKQYIFVPSQAQTARTNGTITAAPSGGYSVPIVNGRIYAFHRDSGQPVWQSAATVEDYSLPLGQPMESPVLLLLRNERLRDGGRLRQTYSGICLDRRDGRLIHQEKNTPGSLTLYEVEGNPEEKTVTLTLGMRKTTLKFTDDAAPPEPPAQLGVSATTAADEVGDAVKRAADALFRNLVPLPAP